MSERIEDIERLIERLEIQRDQAWQRAAELERERDAAITRSDRSRPHMPAVALAWLGAACFAVILIVLLQVQHRGPLVWDEVGRVIAGAELAFALRAGELITAWNWIHNQVYWPFLPSALSGLVLIFSDPMTAAWLPSVVAFGLVGVLAGWLTMAMGGGQTGAWLAALMTWLTPMTARLAAGAFTELLGACQLLLLLWLLIRAECDTTYRSATLAGVVAAIGWFIKYDYGILGTAIIGGTGLYTFAVRRSFGSLVPYIVAGGTTAVTFGTWLIFNSGPKFRALWAFINSEVPGASHGIAWGFYPEQLLFDEEVGLVPLMAVLVVVGVAWAIVTSVRRVEVRGAAVCLVLAYVMYSLATDSKPPYARYLGPILPIITAVTAGAVMDLIFRVRSWFVGAEREPAPPLSRHRFWLPHWGGRLSVRAFNAALLMPILALLGWQLVHQANAESGIDKPFWFLLPYGAVNEALEFGATTAGPGDRPVLMLGQANELNYYSLRLSWSQELGRLAPEVIPVPEAPPEQRRETLMNTITESGASRIVGFIVASGSQLNTPVFRQYFGSQADYLKIARELEEQGVLKRIGEFPADEGRLTTIVWEIVEQPPA